tara:strand:- start:2179 stop:2394 length:216 start_codon:yes stop_codon:yes gene_type:complete
MKGKLYNLAFEIDKKGNIKGPLVIKETIEIVLKSYENNPDIGNFYVYVLNKTFGKNFKLTSKNESRKNEIN